MRSCKACAEAQEIETQSFFIKWKNATVQFTACDLHAMEIITALKKAQKEDFSKEKEKTNEG